MHRKTSKSPFIKEGPACQRLARKGTAMPKRQNVFHTIGNQVSNMPLPNRTTPDNQKAQWYFGKICHL